MDRLNLTQTKNMLIAVADHLIDNTELLTKVDSMIGDGDHGIGMSIGAQSGKKALEELQDPPSIGSIFRTLGISMMTSMGGASGVLFGTMFISCARYDPNAQFLSPDSLANMLRISLDAVKERGKAQLGDKTMVDALEPAVLAMEATHETGFVQMLESAEIAALSGLEKTKLYPAKFGRAKSLQQRSIGYQDAGATSIWLIFQAMAQFVKQLE